MATTAVVMITEAKQADDIVGGPRRGGHCALCAREMCTQYLLACAPLLLRWARSASWPVQYLRAAPQGYLRHPRASIERERRG